MYSSLSLLSFCMSQAKSVELISLRMKSQSILLYSISLVQTSHWPIQLYKKQFYNEFIRFQSYQQLRQNVIKDQMCRNKQKIHIRQIQVLKFQFNMKTNDHEKLLKAIMRWQPRTPKQLEASNAFKQYMIKRKKKIQILQTKSVANQIYIFPRKKIQSSSSSSSISDNLDNQKNQPLFYDLVKQNMRNKSYQYSSQIFLRNQSQVDKATGRQSSKGKKQLNQTFHKNELYQSLNKGHFHKQQSPVKVNSKKNKKPDEKTVLHSSKKLIVAQQYSLGTNPNQTNTKKGSQNATLSCRWKPPRTRTKTEM